MNNNFDEINEEDQHPHCMNNSNRVIHIPVQHFSSSSPGAHSNPENLGHHQPQEHHLHHNPNQDFFNRSAQGIFDDFHSPFDLIDSRLSDSPFKSNRSLFNREQPLGSRFEQLLRPHLSTSPHSSDQNIYRSGKSPNRDVFRQTSPAPGHIQESNNIERKSRQSPTTFRTGSPSIRTDSPRNHSGIQIPIQHLPINSDFRLRTDSPTQNSPNQKDNLHQRQQSPPKQKPKPTIVLPEPPQKVPKQGPSDFIKNNVSQQPTSHPTKPTSEPTKPVKTQHQFKEQPKVNLPKVIPLPEPEHHFKPEEENKQNQDKQEQTQDKNMGNTFQGQHQTNKRPGQTTQSDFAHPRTSPQPEEPHPHHPPAPVIKTSKEKLDEIAIVLENYEIELSTVKIGCGKKDKLYLKLEELVTRCLLKLDEIERSDDIFALRKSLIVRSNKILDRLEQIASGIEPEVETKEDNEQQSSNSESPEKLTTSNESTSANEKQVDDQ